LKQERKMRGKRKMPISGPGGLITSIPKEQKINDETRSLTEGKDKQEE